MEKVCKYLAPQQVDRDRVGTMEPVGTRLKRQREFLRLTQDELGALALTDQTTISDIETGLTKRPRNRTVERVFEALRRLAVERGLGDQFEFAEAVEGIDETEILKRRLIKLEIELGRREQEVDFLRSKLRLLEARDEAPVQVDGANEIVTIEEAD